MLIPFFALLQEHAAGASAAAAEAGAEAQGGLLTPHGGLMFWTLLIFVILLVVLTKFAFKPITAAVEAREKALQDAINAAQKNREDSERMLAEQRAGIESARNEAQRFIAEGRAAGDKMRTEMIAETRVQQQELLDRARKEIESEKEKAIADLRREAIELAIAGASKVIEKNLDDASNRKIVESFLASVAIGTKDKH
jgi:F-type H+-transporting ATPase subunit b